MRKDEEGHWVCWMSTGRKDGLMCRGRFNVQSTHIKPLFLTSTQRHEQYAPLFVLVHLLFRPDCSSYYVLEIE